jgi:hypothetical protein
VLVAFGKATTSACLAWRGLSRMGQGRLPIAKVAVAVGAFAASLLVVPGSAAHAGQLPAGAWAEVSGQPGQLAGITALSPTDAWAVGTGGSAGGGSSLILHWNGKSWSAVPSPSPGQVNYLQGISAVSAKDIWAVGWYFTAHAKYARPLFLHWNGHVWTAVRANASMAGYAPYAVSVRTASDAWAVGIDLAHYNPPDLSWPALILHWNGESWTKVNSPRAGKGDNDLAGVAATGASAAWATGKYFDYSAHPAAHVLLEHWNGSGWVRLANGRPNWYLDDISASSPTNIWAVGGTENGTLIERWQGHGWNQVKSPSPPDSSLGPVAVHSANDAWAVGEAGLNRIISFAEHWNGHEWSQIAIPAYGPPSAFKGITGVAIGGPSSVWAVGTYDKSEHVHMIIFHWNGTSWSEQ